MFGRVALGRVGLGTGGVTSVVPRLLGGLKEVKEDIPLALQVKYCATARHEKMRKALAMDEAGESIESQ
jgi:hypothetical protein